MEITLLTGSPHKHGTSALLADRFAEGARRAGHKLFRFNAAFEKVAPCLGCGYCRANGGDCVHKDSMERLNPELIKADMVVFATPLYYFGMSAQLKAVIDRFYAHNIKLRQSKKQTILMAASQDGEDWTMQALTKHYETILRYLNWTDAGILLAASCDARSDIEQTDYPEKAFNLGNML